jgi:hypothetical protein
MITIELRRGLKIEMPEAANAKWNALQIARQDAEDAGRSAANRLNNLPRDADRELVAGWTAKRDSCNARHQQLSRLVNLVNEWLMKLSANTVLQLTPGIGYVEMKSGQTLMDAIACARTDIAGLQSQLQIVSRAPLPLETQQEIAEADFERRARRAGPTVGIDMRGQLFLRWKDDVVTAKDDVFDLILCIMGQEGRAALAKKAIATLPTPINPMSAEERKVRVAELEAQLHELEQLEEGLILRAEAEGLDVLRRPEASPAVVLGIAIKPKAQASSQVA